MRDAIDHAIVRALRRDGRLSVRALAETVHISRSAAHDRLRQLTADGVISGFRAEVDVAAAGLPVRALLVVDTGSTAAGADLVDRLLEVPYVIRVQTLAGDVDYVIEVAAPTHDALSTTVLGRVLRMPGVASVRTHLVIGERTRDPFDDVPVGTDAATDSR